MRITLVAASLLAAGTAVAEPCSSETIAGKWLYGFCPIEISERGDVPLTECFQEEGDGRTLTVSGRIRTSKNCSVSGDIKRIITSDTGDSVSRLRLEGWISGDRTRIDGLAYWGGSKRPSHDFKMVRQSDLH